MSSRPLAFPDDCPYYHYLRCNNFSSSSSASVVMPFDVDATRRCCSMGNVILRRARSVLSWDGTWTSWGRDVQDMFTIFICPGHI